MNEEEKKEIELDIEAKYVGKTEKEFLSRLTYAECLYILTPENEYCDEVIKLSVLKICEIIDKLQKENNRLRYENCRLKTIRYATDFGTESIHLIPESSLVEINTNRYMIEIENGRFVDLKQVYQENVELKKENEKLKKGE